MNADLITPLVSESFSNNAAGGSGSFPKDGTWPTLVAQPENAVFSYDAARNSYTVTISGRSITFLPSQITAGLSNSAVTVYEVDNRGTTDTLTLTNAGTSGRFTFQYVGGGYWQHTVDGANAVNGSVDAITYGAQSPAAAVPSSGRAQYDVDFIGAETGSTGLVGFTGTGSVKLDLASGVITIAGQLGPTGLESQGFTGNANLTSGTSGFSGSFQLNFAGAAVTGQLNGHLYGPQAQEVGASFSGAFGAQAAVGTLMGRGGVTPNIPFDPAKANAEVAGFTTTYDSAAHVGTGTTAHDLPMEVRYDSTSNTYTLINADRSFAGQPGVTQTFGTDSDALNAYVTQPYADMKAFHWLDRRGGGSTQKIYVTDFIVGNRTSDAALPRAGRAGYNVEVKGSNVDRYGNFLGGVPAVQGDGALYVDFGSGAITVDGTLSDDAFSRVGYKGTAQLSSSANAFSGKIEVADTSGYSGAWNGHFYGTAADQVGSSATLSNGSGDVLSVLLLGANDPALHLDYTGLNDLTSVKTFTAPYGYDTYINPSTFTDGSVTYDPQNHNYKVVTYLDKFQFGDADKDDVLSNATYTAYALHFDDVATDVIARVFNTGPSNPALALTYTSMVDLFLIPRRPGANPNEYTHVTSIFGMNTPAAQIPKSGTASYSGVVIGGGTTFSNGPGAQYYALSGTSKFDFDFASSKMSGTLSLTGRENVSGATRDFGNLSFTGTAPSGNSGSAQFIGSLPTANGSITGAFYGPKGVELGAVFSIDKTWGDEQMFFSGGTVAKKN